MKHLPIIVIILILVAACGEDNEILSPLQTEPTPVWTPEGGLVITGALADQILAQRDFPTTAPTLAFDEYALYFDDGLVVLASKWLELQPNNFMLSEVNGRRVADPSIGAMVVETYTKVLTDKGASRGFYSTVILFDGPASATNFLNLEGIGTAVVESGAVNSDWASTLDGSSRLALELRDGKYTQRTESIYLLKGPIVVIHSATIKGYGDSLEDRILQFGYLFDQLEPAATQTASVLE